MIMIAQLTDRIPFSDVGTNSSQASEWPLIYTCVTTHRDLIWKHRYILWDKDDFHKTWHLLAKMSQKLSIYI